MTRATSKTLAAIGGAVALVASVAGLIAIVLGIGGDVAVVRSDVARHETTIAAQAQALHALELGTVVVPTRLEEITRSHTARVPGIRGRVDMNRFRGTRAELRARRRRR